MRDLLQEQCTLFHLVPCTVCLRGRKLYRANCVVPRGNRDRWCSGERARLPPVWPGFDSRSWCHMWIEFVIGSPPYSEGISPGTLVFLPP